MSNMFEVPNGDDKRISGDPSSHELEEEFGDGKQTRNRKPRTKRRSGRYFARMVCQRQRGCVLGRKR